MTEIKSLPDLVSASRDIHRRFPNQPWWRGHAIASWDLIASVFRERQTRGASYEANINNRFEQRAWTRYPACPPSGQLHRWLFLMRHYELPTRLIDWTESPLVALHFVVANQKMDGSDGALWAFDPFHLNEFRVTVPGPLQPGAKPVWALFESAFAVGAPDVDEVYAVVAAEVDPKMMVQQSAFTIHGSPNPLNLHGGHDDFLVKFTVPAAAKANVRQQLQEMGIREMALFPDLYHLASDLAGGIYP